MFSKLSCSIRGVGDPPIKYQLSASVVPITWDKYDVGFLPFAVYIVDGWIDGWTFRPAYSTASLPHQKKRFLKGGRPSITGIII